MFSQFSSKSQFYAWFELPFFWTAVISCYRFKIASYERTFQKKSIARLNTEKFSNPDFQPKKSFWSKKHEIRNWVNFEIFQKLLYFFLIFNPKWPFRPENKNFEILRYSAYQGNFEKKEIWKKKSRNSFPLSYMTLPKII